MTRATFLEYSGTHIFLLENFPPLSVTRPRFEYKHNMADVRSMLRAERANRRITHPNASYTADGKLSCNLCEAIIKTEAAWQSHLHSTGHILRSSRAHDAATTREVDNNGKKRKASTLEASPLADRKRVKPDLTPPVATATRQVVDEKKHEYREKSQQDGDISESPDRYLPAPENGLVDNPDPHDSSTAEIALPDSVLDDELAAFEKDLAAIEASHAVSALTAPATISAAPITAEEIAAQAREEQSTQHGKRDAEIDEEREDAARMLQEEFEEMENLEERVKRLREKRELLRKSSIDNANRQQVAAVVGSGIMTTGEPVIDEGEAEEEEDDDEDEDFDAWTFGGR